MKYTKLFNHLSASFGFSNNRLSKKTDIVNKQIAIPLTSNKNSSNKIFDSFFGFVNENHIPSRIFIHFTRDKTIADSILENGFKFAECFYRTSQEVTLNNVELKYKFNLYKDYGNYLIILSIPKELFENSPFDENSDQKISLIENGLCNEIKDDYFNFILPNIFINGYFDLLKNNIKRNEKFLKGFELEFYKSRIREEFKKKSNSPP